MATILEFRASEEKPTQRPAKRKRRSAEIVIFPGVRYERWDDATPAVAAPGASRDASKTAD